MVGKESEEIYVTVVMVKRPARSGQTELDPNRLTQALLDGLTGQQPAAQAQVVRFERTGAAPAAIQRANSNTPRQLVGTRSGDRAARYGLVRLGLGLALSLPLFAAAAYFFSRIK